MRHITENYIAGAFRPVSGTATAPLFDPATASQIGSVRLSGADDVDAAVAAAGAALPALAAMSPAERADMLRQLGAAFSRHTDRLADAMRAEYGAPAPFVAFSAAHAGSAFAQMADEVEAYPWRQRIGDAEVEMRAAGVTAAITPWNANYGFICSKLATSIAAGAPMVVKPSELSAIQTQVLVEALHEAGLPAGVFNVIQGDGPGAGARLAAHPGIARITFTGSTASGRAVLHAAADTIKRVTLELGGKGAQVVLDDADLDSAARQVLVNGFINSGQACIAGTRVLVPASRKATFEARLVAALADWPVGPAYDDRARIGPMVSEKQWSRVQSYIRLGVDEGARLLGGGEGRPEGLEHGWFVRPTLFADANNAMRIAREEIFGPVLCLIPYDGDADAVRIANDTTYGLQNYVIGTDRNRARAVAGQLESGRVMINDAVHEPRAPFGGFKQSGQGREFGCFGLDTFLEPRTILG